MATLSGYYCQLTIIVNVQGIPLTNTVIRWGIIGCGKVTEVKSGPAYQQTEGFELAAVMRRDAAKAEDYATRHGIETYYSDADTLINNPDIDAIYIATPPDSHKYYALKVATVGKPCCIEKPMAPDHHDCVVIEEAFKAKKLPLFVAYYRRSLPRFKQIASWLDDGEIGDVRHISWHLSKPPNELDLSSQYNWRTDPAIAPAGYFDDLASHGLDLITHLLGDVEQAKGISTNQQGLYQAKDAITAIWQHRNGVTGSGSWNFGCTHRQDTVEIFGSKGKLRFSVFDESPLQLSNENGVTERVIDNPPNIQLYHVQNMRDALLHGGTHPSTGHSAAHTAWFMGQIIGV